MAWTCVPIAGAAPWQFSLETLPSSLCDAPKVEQTAGFPVNLPYSGRQSWDCQCEHSEQRGT